MKAQRQLETNLVCAMGRAGYEQSGGAYAEEIAELSAS